MPEQLKQLGLTPLKAGVIGALLLLLAVVWGPQLVPLIASDEVPVANRRAPKRAPTPRNPIRSQQQAPTLSRPSDVATSSPPVREYSVAEASTYDPFATPDWGRAPDRPGNGMSEFEDAAPEDDRLEKLAATGVSMVLVSNGGHAATIGDRLVHVGDEIDGYRVVEISGDGVLLQPAASADSEGSRGL